MKAFVVGDEYIDITDRADWDVRFTRETSKQLPLFQNL